MAEKRGISESPQPRGGVGHVVVYSGEEINASGEVTFAEDQGGGLVEGDRRRSSKCGASTHLGDSCRVFLRQRRSKTRHWHAAQ